MSIWNIESPNERPNLRRPTRSWRRSATPSLTICGPRFANKSAALDTDSSEYLRTIAASARQMGRLIDDLLAFSRTARAELRKTAISLSDLVQAVLRDLRPDQE